MKTPRSILPKTLVFVLALVGINTLIQINSPVTSAADCGADAYILCGPIDAGQYLIVGRENIYVDSGEKSNEDGTATYNAESNTLTLNNYNNSNDSIHSSGFSELSIFFSGQNSVDMIFSDGSLVINGDGSLSCGSTETSCMGSNFGISINGGNIVANGGIYNSNQDLNINGGNIEIQSKFRSIQTYGGDLNINGGNITVSSDNGSIYIYDGDLNINGGTLAIDSTVPEAILLESHDGTDHKINISNSIHTLESGLGVKKVTFDWEDIWYKTNGRGSYTTIGPNDTNYDLEFGLFQNAATTIHFGSEYENDLAEEISVSELGETITLGGIGSADDDLDDYIITLPGENDSSIEFNYIPEYELSLDISKNEDKDLNAKIADKLSAGQEFVALDISVYDGDNLVHEADDENGFKLTMPIPEELKDYDKIYFQYVSTDESGNVSLGDKIVATIKDGYIIVVLPHLSTFIVVGDTDITVETPNTGAFTKATDNNAIISLISCIATGIVAAFIMMPKIRKHIK